MYVFDATPLIYLAKAERLALVLEQLDECCTTDAVYEEVVTRGVEEGHPDARRIERAVKDGSLRVVPVDETPTLERLQGNENFSTADATVLALAVDRSGVAVVDERYGRTVANAEDIETRGTVYLVLRLLRDDRISASEARDTIDQMVDAGWYCAPNLYAKIVRRIEELS
jgi:predicted nucleic acid-binding protein